MIQDEVKRLLTPLARGGVNEMKLQNSEPDLLVGEAITAVESIDGTAMVIAG